MARITVAVEVSGRRREHSPDQHVDWRPLPNERRNRERRGTQGFARFVGPGGDAEHTMTKDDARAIAQALGIPFEDRSWVAELVPDQKSLHS